MSIDFKIDARKDEVFEAVQQYIDQQGFEVVSKDFNRPWGGFFVPAHPPSSRLSRPVQRTSFQRFRRTTWSIAGSAAGGD